MRHTYASHFMMSGGNLGDLQSILGHSSPMMTGRYAHLSPHHLISKANVFGITVSENPVGNVITFPAHTKFAVLSGT